MDLCDLVYRAVYSNARLENVMLIRTLLGEDLDSVPVSLYYEPWDTLRDLFPGRNVFVSLGQPFFTSGSVELPWPEEATACVALRRRVAAWVQGNKVTLDFDYNPALDNNEAPPGCSCGAVSVADCMCINGIEYLLPEVLR